MTIYGHAFYAWYPFRARPWVASLTVGAVAPDLPYVLSFVWAVATLGPDALGDLQLWDRLWRSTAVELLHAYPPWLLAAGLFVTARWLAADHATRLTWDRAAAFVGGWGSHVVIDMLTHRTDGYPVLWPFSETRFPTPLSYWEPEYYGVPFALLSHGLMLGLGGRLVWRRFLRRRLATTARE